MEQFLSFEFFIHLFVILFAGFIAFIIFATLLNEIVDDERAGCAFLALAFVGIMGYSVYYALHTAPGLPIDDKKAIAKIEYLEQEGLVSSYKLRQEETCFIEYINRSELDKEGESAPSFSRDTFDCTQASSAADRIYDLLTTNDLTALYTQAQPETLKRVQAMQDAGLYIRFYSTTSGQCTMRTIDNERHIDSRITHDCKQFDKFIKNYARELGL